MSREGETPGKPLRKRGMGLALDDVAASTYRVNRGDGGGESVGIMPASLPHAPSEPHTPMKATDVLARGELFVRQFRTEGNARSLHGGHLLPP